MQNELLAQLQALWRQPPTVPPTASPPHSLDGERGDQADDDRADASDFLDLMADADRAEYLGPRRQPEPCPWCGGRLRHNPLCVALCDDWAVKMPFGKHKGRPVRDLDPDYLAWLLRSDAKLTDDVRAEIARVLTEGGT